MINVKKRAIQIRWITFNAAAAAADAVPIVVVVVAIIIIILFMILLELNGRCCAFVSSSSSLAVAKWFKILVNLFDILIAVIYPQRTHMYANQLSNYSPQKDLFLLSTDRIIEKKERKK